MAHAGGIMTTNKEEALRKFAERKDGAAGERARVAIRQLEERREEEGMAKKARVSAPEQTEGRLLLSTGEKRKAEVLILTADEESDEASEVDAGQAEAKRRRGGERAAAEEGEGAIRARAAGAGGEESMQAGDAAAQAGRGAAHNDDEEDDGAAPAAKTKKKRKWARGKSRAHRSFRMRAARRDD